MPPVRKIASVRVSEPVSGLRRRRSGTRAPRQRLDLHIKVDPRIMAVVRKRRRPGERLRIVSETEVWLVNDVAS